jgi:hypothetical protein
MSEAIRYQYYNLPALGGMAEVDPGTLEYHPCRTVLNMTPELARRIWESHLESHTPIRIRFRDIVDGTVRVQAALLLSITPIVVLRH